MSNGDRWRLPDGAEGVEVGRSGRQIRVMPIDASSPAGVGAPVIAWVDRCTALGSRYLGGQVPVQPAPPTPTSSSRN